MATHPVTAKGRKTRARIVATAVEVVAERGAVEATLDEVGSRATASRSQLYHYFDDKAALLCAVAEATNDAVLDGQALLLDQLGSIAGLRVWADALVALQQAQRGRGGCPIGNLVGQVGERDEQIRRVLATGFDRWEQALADGVAAMVDAGELDPATDIGWLATCLLAAVQGGLMLTQARRDPQQLRRSLDGAIRLVELHAVKGRPPSG